VKEIQSELTVDIVKFIKVFVFRFQIGRKFSFVGKVIAAFGIDALVDTKAFAVFLWYQYVATIRTTQFKGMVIDVIGAKAFFTYFAKELTFGAIVFVEIIMWSPTTRTD